MRRRNKVVLSLIFVVVALSVTAHGQQSAYHQEVFTGPRAGARVHSGTGTGYHQIAWNTSGGPGACLLGLDYSEDGMVWYLGATIPIHDCTASGTSIIAGPQNVQFVRMNMNALSTGSAVRATYTGFQTNPGGPTGTVTSVFGRTGQIQAQAGDYSVALITGAAPLFSPNFQGSPTAPTPSPGDNSTLVATTAFVTQAIAACGCGGGGGGAGVSSFNGRTGAVVPQASDYSAFFAPIGTGGGGGLSGSGTINLISKFTAATTLGNSLLTDDGTSLTYTGTGGIVAPKLTITQGPFQLTSVTGAVPGLPGTGNNALVSGPDGWYVSNNNSAYFKLEPPGTGGTGGAVSSVFTRTGAVTAAQGDYSVSQITGAAPLANPTFTGTAFAPAPSGAGAVTPGNNQIATTAFVFANAGGTISGVSAFNTRTGAVVPNAGDYTVAQVTGAAGLASPIFTGTPQAPTPATSDSSDKIATTAFVKAAMAGGGGVMPIGRSAMIPACVSNDTATNATLSNIPIGIAAGDAVLVSVSTPNSLTTGGATTTVTDDATGGSNNYQPIATRNQGATPTITTLNLLGVVGARPATSMTVTQSQPSKFVVCIATYVGVTGFGASPYVNSAGNFTNPLTASFAVPDGGYIFAASGVPVGSSFSPTWNPGQLLTTHVSTTPGPAQGSICENGSTTAATVTCQVTWGSGTYPQLIAAVELLPGVSTGPAPTFPKVVTYNKATINVTSSVTDTPFMLCLITECPAGGFYRIAWDFLGITGCTSGVFQVNVDYIDEASPTSIHHTGMMSDPGATISGTNHVFGSRLMTVAAPLPTAVPPQSWPANTGINITTSVPTACSGAAGKVQMVVSVERLQ